MSLRDRYLSLRTVVAPAGALQDLLHVARPRECNNATNAADDATARATATQQTAGNPRESSLLSATAHATTTQQGQKTRATTVQQTAGAGATPAPAQRDLLRVARVGFSETQQRNNDLTEALVDAITRACDVRGNEAEHRAELLAECTALSPEGQAEMLAHFTVEAARWVAPEPDRRVTCNTCAHYRPHRCNNSGAAGLQSPDVSRDLAALFQDCAGFEVAP